MKTEKTWTGLERPSPIDKSLVKRMWKLIPELWYYLWLAGHKRVLRLAVWQTVHNSRFIVGSSHSQVAFFCCLYKALGWRILLGISTWGVRVGRVLLTIEVKLLGQGYGAEMGAHLKHGYSGQAPSWLFCYTVCLYSGTASGWASVDLRVPGRVILKPYIMTNLREVRKQS